MSEATITHAPSPELIVSLRGISTRFGRKVVHEGLDLDI